MHIIKPITTGAGLVLLLVSSSLGEAWAGDQPRTDSDGRAAAVSDLVLGNRAYDREDLPAAIRHYRQALRADPNDIVIHDRLLAAEREYREDARLTRLYTAHFVVAFPREVSPRDANRIADRLETVARALEAPLPYVPAQPFAVVLYTRPQFHAATFTPPWTKAVFDGKIRLLLDDRSGLSDDALRHEYVHAVVHRLSGGNVPAWLSEGLALFFDGGRHGVPRRRGDVRPPYLPLTSRHADLISLSPADARAAYRHSYDVTRALLAQYGLVRVRMLLERLSRTPSFAAAFESVLGERFVEFERHWTAEQDRDER